MPPCSHHVLRIIRRKATRTMNCATERCSAENRYHKQQWNGSKNGKPTTRKTTNSKSTSNMKGKRYAKLRNTSPRKRKQRQRQRQRNETNKNATTTGTTGTTTTIAIKLYRILMMILRYYTYLVQDDKFILLLRFY